jgi:AraC-like DNA-binding protein
MDILSLLFSRFSLTTQVFYSGALCLSESFDVPAGFAYIHVLRAGCLHISCADGSMQRVAQPSLIFYQGPGQHHFQVDTQPGATLVCAAVDFGAGLHNPMLRGIPSFLLTPLADINGVDATLSLLFAEALVTDAKQQAGRQAGIDRLMEYFLILLLRHLIATHQIGHGVLAALADARLCRAITAMHQQPERAWTLASLAQVAGMSRTRFAAHFRETTGSTALDYLTDWRISVAQTMLKRGQAFKMVAPQVGYSSSVALRRVFQRRLGLSPLEWLAGQQSNGVRF